MPKHYDQSKGSSGPVKSAQAVDTTVLGRHGATTLTTSGPLVKRACSGALSPSASTRGDIRNMMSAESLDRRARTFARSDTVASFFTACSESSPFVSPRGACLSRSNTCASLAASDIGSAETHDCNSRLSRSVAVTSLKSLGDAPGLGMRCIGRSVSPQADRQDNARALLRSDTVTSWKSACSSDYRVASATKADRQLTRSRSGMAVQPKNAGQSPTPPSVARSGANSWSKSGTATSLTRSRSGNMTPPMKDRSGVCDTAPPGSVGTASVASKSGVLLTRANSKEDVSSECSGSTLKATPRTCNQGVGTAANVKAAHMLTRQVNSRWPSPGGGGGALATHPNAMADQKSQMPHHISPRFAFEPSDVEVPLVEDVPSVAAAKGDIESAGRPNVEQVSRPWLACSGDISRSPALQSQSPKKRPSMVPLLCLQQTQQPRLLGRQSSGKLLLGGDSSPGPGGSDVDGEPWSSKLALEPNSPECVPLHLSATSVRSVPGHLDVEELNEDTNGEESWSSKLVRALISPAGTSSQEGDRKHDVGQPLLLQYDGPVPFPWELPLRLHSPRKRDKLPELKVGCDFGQFDGWSILLKSEAQVPFNWTLPLRLHSPRARLPAMRPLEGKFVEAQQSLLVKSEVRLPFSWQLPLRLHSPIGASGLASSEHAAVFLPFADRGRQLASLAGQGAHRSNSMGSSCSSRIGEGLRRSCAAECVAFWSSDIAEADASLMLEQQSSASELERPEAAPSERAGSSPAASSSPVSSVWEPAGEAALRSTESPEAGARNIAVQPASAPHDEGDRTSPLEASRGSSVLCDAAPKSVVGRIWQVAGKPSEVLQLVQEAELLHATRGGNDPLADVYMVAVEAYGLRQSPAPNELCDLSVKAMRLLCRGSDTTAAARFHEKLRRSSVGQREARLFEARASQLERLGEVEAAAEVLNDGRRSGAGPVRILERKLALLTGAATPGRSARASLPVGAYQVRDSSVGFTPTATPRLSQATPRLSGASAHGDMETLRSQVRSLQSELEFRRSGSFCPPCPSVRGSNPFSARSSLQTYSARNSPHPHSARSSLQSNMAGCRLSSMAPCGEAAHCRLSLPAPSPQGRELSQRPEIKITESIVTRELSDSSNTGVASVAT